MNRSSFSKSAFNPSRSRASAGAISRATSTAGSRAAAAQTAGAKKTAAEKQDAKKANSKKSGAKKTVTRKPATKKAAAAKKPATKKTTAKKSSPAKKSAPAKGKGATLEPIGKRVRVNAKKDETAASKDSSRSLGLRGAAPWVARHAAKHAEELRRRNAEPPPPGSARATLCTPDNAEELKQQIATLHQRVSEIQTMRRKLDDTFFEIGLVLQEVQRDNMYVAKGYSSFDAFAERETGLKRSLAHRLIRIVQTFQRDTAYDFGLDRVLAALAALDGALVTAPASNPSRPSGRNPSSRSMGRKTLRWDE